MKVDDYRGIQDIQTFPKLLLQQAIKPGDTVIDGTAGRGRDTLFLAHCVGEPGQVISFDIQREAIQSTYESLKNHNLDQRVRLVQKCHSEIPQYVPKRIKAAVFNLGYLPGGDHEITTKSSTTLLALKNILPILEVQGIIAITIYRAHSGAESESYMVKSFASSLSKKDFSVLQGIYLNQGENSPYWIVIQKNREEHR